MGLISRLIIWKINQKLQLVIIKVWTSHGLANLYIFFFKWLALHLKPTRSNNDVWEVSPKFTYIPRMNLYSPDEPILWAYITVIIIVFYAFIPRLQIWFPDPENLQLDLLEVYIFSVWSIIKEKKLYVLQFLLIFSFWKIM